MLYGVAAAVMLASVVLWFSSYNEVMTSDKFVYLFGRVIPALSLVLSMALRFIPKFRAQMQTVSEAQACIGRDTKNGSVFRRVGNAVKIFSIMLTWALENAIHALRRRTACKARAATACRGGRLFRSTAFVDRDRGRVWHGFCSAGRISSPALDGRAALYWPVLSDGRRPRHGHAADGELSCWCILALVPDAGDSRPEGRTGCGTLCNQTSEFCVSRTGEERDLRFLAVRPAGRISGGLRSVRLREIDAAAAAAKPSLRRTARRSGRDPV